MSEKMLLGGLEDKYQTWYTSIFSALIGRSQALFSPGLPRPHPQYMHMYVCKIEAVMDVLSLFSANKSS